MPTVVIDGIPYVPRADIPELTDDRLNEALKQLVTMQYLKQTHKAVAQAWNVLDTLAPELAELAASDPKAAYDRMHPNGD